MPLLPHIPLIFCFIQFYECTSTGALHTYVMLPNMLRKIKKKEGINSSYPRQSQLKSKYLNFGAS